jgi:hypothetical protein
MSFSATYELESDEHLENHALIGSFRTPNNSAMFLGDSIKDFGFADEADD